MKKILAFLLVIVLSAGVVQAAAADNSVKVVVDGEMVQFDQPPVIIDGRTLVPIRMVAQKIGATVNWNGATQVTSIQKGNVGVALGIGNYKLTVVDIPTNKTYVETLDVPPQLINNRTLMPIRVIVEKFGCKVAWDQGTSTVIITTPEYDPSKARKTIVIGE